MKIAMQIVIDDKQIVFSANASIEPEGEDGKIDITSAQWTIYGMLMQAMLDVKLRAAVRPPAEALGAPSAPGAKQ